ncbi:MAG TPA: hypothetical protein VER55_06980 [Ardenticatenaceae bacterium]|nr:hypothetical protein [Ardenticatenaceae bacterium]
MTIRTPAASKLNEPIIPGPRLIQTKVPNVTPKIVARYAASEKEVLLATIRYNRLLDVFTGATCYSLQTHLRTSLPAVGEVETDEIYVGANREETHYVLAVRVGCDKHELTPFQIERDLAVCAWRFPGLVCFAVGARFVEDDLIALFQFDLVEAGVGLLSEKHYRLVPPDYVTSDDLAEYRRRLVKE